MGRFWDFLVGNGEFGAEGGGDFMLGARPGSKVQVETYETVGGHQVMIVRGKFVRVDTVDQKGKRGRAEEVTLGPAVAGRRGERVTVDWMNKHVVDMTVKGKHIGRTMTIEQAAAAIEERRRTGGIKGRR